MRSELSESGKHSKSNMIEILVPNYKRLTWYLAAEEYLGQNILSYAEGVFFTWIVKPTVIFGRHQVMAEEVNLKFCEENDIQTYRRKSGGGCVYADEGNLMLSYIVPKTHAEKVFQEYLDNIASLLRKLGLNAVKTEHNDILVDGRKVSGNACYALRDGTIVHGTMLYDVDFTQLQQAITPSVEKMAKHGVQSVRQRVRNIRPLFGNTSDINQLAKHLTKGLCTESRQLAEEDIKAIDTIEATYLNPDFLYSK